MKRRSLKQIARSKIFWLITAAVIARIILVLVYDPQVWPETHRYLTLAREIESGDYSQYIGKNVPGYSLLIIVSSFNLHLLFFVQILLGLLTTSLIFRIFTLVSESSWTGLLAGLAYAVNPGLLLFEASFLPEPVCTFLLTLTVWLVVENSKGRLSERWWIYLLLGFTCLFCLMTRPHYLFLPFIVFLSISCRWKRKPAQLTLFLLAFSLPVVLGLGAWLNFQKKHARKASITTHSGITLLYHPFNFIEHAPGGYDSVKLILMEKYKYYMVNKGDTYGAVEAAIPEVMEKRGLDYTGVDSLYMKIALDTIKERPDLYMLSVFKAMLRFFKPVWYAPDFGIRGVLGGESTGAKVVAVLYSFILLSLLAVFLMIPMPVLSIGRLRRRFLADGEFLFIYFIVWVAAFIQAFLVLGENNRFRVSVEPLMLGITVWIIVEIIRILKDRRLAGNDETIRSRTFKE